jgi:hypothetical protein
MLKKQVFFALFLIMVIMQPQNAQGADVLAARNWGTILRFAHGLSAATAIPLSTNTIDSATVIVLSSFTAVPSETKINTIDINWVTSSEIDTAGFNIYRDEAENGQYTTQLNPELIPSTGSSTNGVSYDFEDASVATGKIYYYKLEAIDLNGYKKMYGPASANWPCQTDTDCGNGLYCDKDTNQCISNSSSTSTTVPVTTSTSTTISATTSIISTSTTSPVTTSSTTVSPASTTISATTTIINTSTTSSVTTTTTAISPTSTTTTSQLSTTTTNPTTTTTTRSGPCAAEAVYGENAEETELLRKYRDNVLSKTPEGQEIIKIYYKFSPKITMLLKQRPLLKNRAKTFIDRMLPGIRNKVAESNKQP